MPVYFKVIMGKLFVSGIGCIETSHQRKKWIQGGFDGSFNPMFCWNLYCT